MDRVQVVDTTSYDGRDLQETGSNPPTVPGSLQERQEQAQEKTLEEEAVERTLEEEAV